MGIVHKTWLVEGSEATFWPNERNPTKRCRMTIEGVQPRDDWMQVRCVTKGWAGKCLWCLMLLSSQ